MFFEHICITVVRAKTVMPSPARQDAQEVAADCSPIVANLAAEEEDQASSWGAPSQPAEKEVEEASSRGVPTTPRRGPFTRSRLFLSPTSASPLPSQRRIPYPVISPSQRPLRPHVSVSDDDLLAFEARVEAMFEEEEALGLEQGASGLAQESCVARALRRHRARALRRHRGRILGNRFWPTMTLESRLKGIRDYSSSSTTAGRALKAD